jgi:hypothetical protein
MKDDNFPIKEYTIMFLYIVHSLLEEITLIGGELNFV